MTILSFKTKIGSWALVAGFVFASSAQAERYTRLFAVDKEGATYFDKKQNEPQFELRLVQAFKNYVLTADYAQTMFGKMLAMPPKSMEAAQAQFKKMLQFVAVNQSDLLFIRAYMVESQNPILGIKFDNGTYHEQVMSVAYIDANLAFIGQLKTNAIEPMRDLFALNEGGGDARSRQQELVPLVMNFAQVEAPKAEQKIREAYHLAVERFNALFPGE